MTLRVIVLALPVLLAATTAFADAPPPRLVEVSGHGEATAAPDRAHLSLAAQTLGADVRGAQAALDRVMRETLSMLRAQGVADGDIATTGLIVQPQYSELSTKGRHFDGYELTRTVDVTVRDLSHLGDILLGATAAGINQVSEPQLESSGADEARRRALALAVQDARANAQTIATTLGVSLGPAHSVTANASEGAPRPMFAMARMAAKPMVSGNDQMGLTPGELHFSVDVQAQFDLAGP